MPTGVSPTGDLAVAQLQQPQQGAQVVAVAGPQEVAVLRVALEPVDVGEDRLVLRRAHDVEVVLGVVALAVGHEGPVGHRVVAQLALDPLGRERGLGAQRQPVVHALGEVVMARISGSRSRVRPPKMIASIGTPVAAS